MIKECGNCIFMRQGGGSCECGNPKNTSGYKKYVYYNFSCDKFEFSNFEKMNHEEKIKAGYVFNKENNTYGYPKAS